MKRFLFILLALSFQAHGDDSARGTFEEVVQHRPLLEWEVVKGYRLFFHPDDVEPLRRSLVLAIPTDRKVATAYSLVRPLDESKKYDDAWLRIEGELENDKVKFSWDGSYRGAEFPDLMYYYEVHVRWTDGERLDQKVVILKSLDHPKIVKFADINLEEHPLEFSAGEFKAMKINATASKTEFALLPVVAKVLAPNLEETFQTEGIQLSYKMVAAQDGEALTEPHDWVCACQQPLPLDSPARQKAKKVRCDWDLKDVEPAIYELRLSLYHKMKHPAQFDACDTPILDEDRIRVLIRP